MLYIHSLWRHKNNCQSTTTKRKSHGRAAEAAPSVSQPLMVAARKRPIPADISTFNSAEFGTGKPAVTGPRNPKIQGLLDEIINDHGQDMGVTSQKSLTSFAALPAMPRAIPLRGRIYQQEL